jgi:membrane associated rhomboid family serine protease
MTPYSWIAVAIILGGIIFSLVRRVLFSLVMAAVITAVFAIGVLGSLLVNSASILELGFQPVFLRMPENLYTLFTSMFVHANFIHLIFNMIVLILIGPLLEERIGTGRFASIYILSGIIGTLAFGLMHLNDVAIVVGASGAIFGILGAFAVLYPREKISMLYMFIPLPPMRVPYVVAFIIVLETVLALDPTTRTAHEAHLAGLAAGILFAPLVARIGVSPKEEVTLAGLEELVVNDELEAMLRKIEGESVEDVKQAWLEEFVQKASCPKCGGGIRLRGSKVYSDCGWSIRIERKQ